MPIEKKKDNPDTISHENFTLVGRLNATESFAEGTTQILFGHPISKLLLHTVLSPEGQGNTEVRKATEVLSMPTVAMIQLAHLVLSKAKSFEARLMNDLDDTSKRRVMDMLKNFTAASSEPTSITSKSAARPKPRAKLKDN
ncbi:MAG: hypothetical protein K9K30_00855 [Burkholderiaceae bacterium]|nr:hypothetical protein [Sulfuritalea sp.]MCF8173777.1 hypothetical protein [Burkholderiaceae bacterium]